MIIIYFFFYYSTQLNRFNWVLLVLANEWTVNNNIRTAKSTTIAIIFEPPIRDGQSNCWHCYRVFTFQILNESMRVIFFCLQTSFIPDILIRFPRVASFLKAFRILLIHFFFFLISDIIFLITGKKTQGKQKNVRFLYF